MTAPHVTHRTERRQYDPIPLAPAHARRFVTDVLDRWGCAGAGATSEVLTSELVADALRHSPSRIVLHVELRGDAVRIEVSDDPGLIPDPSAGQFERRVARRLVDNLANSWGSDLERGLTTTWCSIRVQDHVSVDAPRAQELADRRDVA